MREMQIEFSSVTISFFVHSTEDINKILPDLANAFGLTQNDIAYEDVEGYFGNVITSAKVHIIGDNAQQSVQKIISRLSDRAKSNIVTELPKSMDMHDSLYLRFDRQTLRGKIELGDDEPIRVKLKPKHRLLDRNMTTRAYVEMLK